MKKIFMKGFIAGALVFSSITALATTSFTALQASFPILINGKPWQTNKPVVVIDGSTYLPLRAIGEVLGVNINWNDSAKRVEIGEISKSLELTDEEAKNIIQNFMKMQIAWSEAGTESILNKLGFGNEDFYVKDENGNYISVPGRDLVVYTNIDYEEFWNELMKYISKDYFYSEGYYVDWFENIDDKLAILRVGGSGSDYEVLNAERISSYGNNYVYRVEMINRWGDEGYKGSDVVVECNFILTVGEHGNYVIDKIY